MFFFNFYDKLITKIRNEIMKKLLILILFLNGFIMATLFRVGEKTYEENKGRGG